MAETKKREKNFERAYSDSTGEITISREEDTVLALSLEAINPEVLKRAAMRYVTDVLVGVGNAAMKAEGGSPATAQAKMEETLKALQEGTFRFRAASGQGGLSEEEEIAVIAETLVSLGKFTDVESATAKVTEIHGRTSTNAKGYTVRKDYNALKNVPQIKVAIANASKQESNLSDLLA